MPATALVNRCRVRLPSAGEAKPGREGLRGLRLGEGLVALIVFIVAFAATVTSTKVFVGRARHSSVSTRWRPGDHC